MNDESKKILNKIVLFGSIIILIMLLLAQCNATKNAKIEAERNFNNLLAKQDSVRIISAKLGSVLVEKSVLELKYSELNKEQEKLVAQLELEKKKKPKIIIDTRIIYKDKYIYVPVKNEIKEGSSFLSFTHDPLLLGTNKFIITGKLPYTFKGDTLSDGSYYPVLTPGNVQLSVDQKIDLVTGIYRDPETNRLYVRAATSFPGITFNNIQAVDVIDGDDKKPINPEKRTFGIGLTLGYGIGILNKNIVPGPMIGIGLHYTPKWLQWGK